MQTDSVSKIENSIQAPVIEAQKVNLSNNIGSSSSDSTAYSSASPELGDSSKKVEEYVEKILKIESTKLIQSLGIFIGLFAFISSNLTLFSRVKDLASALVFTLLLFLLFTSFLLIMDLILNNWEKRLITKLSILIVLLLGIPCSLFLFSKTNVLLNSTDTSEKSHLEYELQELKIINILSEVEERNTKEKIKNCLISAYNLQQVKNCID